jgi:hypothetical protein
MGARPATPPRNNTEAREFLRAMREDNARSREEVARRIASLRRIADFLRGRR